MRDVRRLLERRWWLLPGSVMVLGVVSLRVQVVLSRLRVTTADLVSLQSSLENEMHAGSTTYARVEQATQRLQIATLSLVNLGALVSLVTLLLALVCLRFSEIPWWVRALTIGYALYCSVWAVLTAPLE
ncbi:MAG: hypothetical protein N3C12_12735 [Candidatus Binatia bacterium]|nr:hypothetical protein [Candidatus Binatia bacterium]